MGGLFEGYRLKLNPTDLGFDTSLADAVQRLALQHPEVEGRRDPPPPRRKNRVFCAGANIRDCSRGATPAHVHFCKFTTRPATGSEDSPKISAITSRAYYGTAAVAARAGVATDHIPPRRRRRRCRGAAEVPSRGGFRAPAGLTRGRQGASVLRTMPTFFCNRSMKHQGQGAPSHGDWVAEIAPKKKEKKKRKRKQQVGDQDRRCSPGLCHGFEIFSGNGKGIALAPLNGTIDRTASLLLRPGRSRRAAARTGYGSRSRRRKAAAPPISTGLIGRAQRSEPLPVARELSDHPASAHHELEVALLVFKSHGDPAMC